MYIVFDLVWDRFELGFPSGAFIAMLQLGNKVARARGPNCSQMTQEDHMHTHSTCMPFHEHGIGGKLISDLDDQ
jgi:hypothetical protein